MSAPAPPKTYRVYRLDLDRRSVSADFIKAAHDEEIIAKVGESFVASKCEIWEGRRLVAQLDAERRQA